MAEAIVNSNINDESAAFSADNQPVQWVHPKTVKSLAEVGINWRGRPVKHAAEFKTFSFDLIRTLCDNAREHHPAWLDQNQPAPIHLGFPASVRATGSEAEVRTTFHMVRDAIAEQVPAFLRAWFRSQLTF